MSAKERGLGRGLEALLGEAAGASTETSGHSPLTVPVGDLVPGPYQPRRRFEQSELEALADSIRQYGIMQPILVVKPAVIMEVMAMMVVESMDCSLGY